MIFSDSTSPENKVFCREEEEALARLDIYGFFRGRWPHDPPLETNFQERLMASVAPENRAHFQRRLIASTIPKKRSVAENHFCSRAGASHTTYNKSPYFKEKHLQQVTSACLVGHEMMGDEVLSMVVHHTRPKKKTLTATYARSQRKKSRVSDSSGQQYSYHWYDHNTSWLLIT